MEEQNAVLRFALPNKFECMARDQIHQGIGYRPKQTCPTAVPFISAFAQQSRYLEPARDAFIIGEAIMTLITHTVLTIDEIEGKVIS